MYELEKMFEGEFSHFKYFSENCLVNSQAVLAATGMNGFRID